VYALAAALRMPQHIRGRVHLLAPWIPPSQMAPIGMRQHNGGGGRQLPRSQRFLRVLPPSFLKIANSSFLSATSASITRSMPKSPQNKRRSVSNNNSSSAAASSPPPLPNAGMAPGQPSPDARASTASGGGRPSLGAHRDSMMTMDQIRPKSSALSVARHGGGAGDTSPAARSLAQRERISSAAAQERREQFDERLTVAIWERATANANPATDLIVCLETRHTIGFRYEDITRGVVIHHGSKDSRVPVDNVRWLGRIMRRCEVRILEGEAHGLMANPIVMGNLLMEIAKEWEDWNIVVESSRDRRNEY
jgi:pimeloyl-ACP methyl ester carboxylesterase